MDTGWTLGSTERLWAALVLAFTTLKTCDQLPATVRLSEPVKDGSLAFRI
jgi:hypothetical protein